MNSSVGAIVYERLCFVAVVSSVRGTSTFHRKHADLDRADAAYKDGPDNRRRINNTGHLWNEALAPKPIAIAETASGIATIVF
jgi:hypothetical protein